jgi:hypothetical protein
VPGAELADGTVRYRRTFTVPVAWPADGELVLHFGAVNHCAEVSVNGHDVGRHEGGWTPFELRSTARCWSTGEQTVEVLVSYPPLLAPSADSWGMQEVPHGKQTWYGTNAGIWQSVTLLHRPSHHLEDVLVRTEAGQRRRHRHRDRRRPRPGRRHRRPGRARGAARRQHLRRGAQRAGPGRRVGRRGRPAGPVGHRAVAPAVVALRPGHLLGSVELVDADGTVTDAVTVTTGFRTVETKDGLILLNGEPIELRGILDQDYHPGSELKAATVEELEQLFTEVKRLGFNLLRCHIRRPDPIYFDIANRVGLMVWAELPSWQRFTKRSAAAAEALLEEMITLDGHHPSIVAWSVVNESWGVDLADAEPARLDGPHPALGQDARAEHAGGGQLRLRDQLPRAHRPRRLPRLPRHARAPGQLGRVGRRVRRPPGLELHPVRRRERTGEEPLVVSEFGNWGLPDIAEMAGPDGVDPWWAAPAATGPSARPRPPTRSAASTSTAWTRSSAPGRASSRPPSASSCSAPATRSARCGAARRSPATC